MPMRRGTSISILLVSLLISKLSYCQVARWRQPDEKCMEMRLRRALGKLVTLASHRGHMTRMAKEYEVEKLLAITKWALFSRSLQRGTRRSEPGSWWNPGAWFGENPGFPFGGNIGAGVFAGPKGIWAAVGGIGPMAAGSTWKNETTLEEREGIGFTKPQQSAIWTFTWSPNPSASPVWFTRTPKSQGSTTHSWFSKQPDRPMWVTPNPPKWNFSSTNRPLWNFGSTSLPQWSFAPTQRPNWDLKPTNPPIWLHNSTIKANWFFSTTTKRNWLLAPKAGNHATTPAVENDSNEFTKEIPPWRLPITTIPQNISSSTLASKL